MSDMDLKKGGYLHRIASVLIVAMMMITAVQYELSFLRLEKATHPMLFDLEMEDMFFALSNWRIQHHVLIGVLILLAMLSLFSRSTITKVVFYLLQMLGYGILLFADVFYDISLFTLFLALCCEIHMIADARSATLVSLISGFALVAFPRVDTAWYYVIPSAPADSLFTLGVYAVMSILFLHVLHVLINSVGKERAISNYLKHSVVELSAANVGFQDYAALVEERTAREERNRITREVHDSTGYTLTNISMMMEAAKGLVHTNPGKLRELLETTKEVAQQSLQQIRKTLRLLREEKNVIENPLSLLHRIFTTFEQATNVKVRVEYRNFSLAPHHMVNATLFRIVQEALTNAFWHGNATVVNVLFWYGDGLTMIISDNGAGSENIEEGIGLRGMREQLAEIGGSVQIRSVRGEGFELSIVIPQRSESKGNITMDSIPSECRERKVKDPAPWGENSGKTSSFQSLPCGVDTFHSTEE